MIIHVFDEQNGKFDYFIIEQITGFMIQAMFGVQQPSFNLSHLIRFKTFNKSFRAVLGKEDRFLIELILRERKCVVRHYISRFSIEFEWDVQKINQLFEGDFIYDDLHKFSDILGTIDFFGKNLIWADEISFLQTMIDVQWLQQ